MAQNPLRVMMEEMNKSAGKGVTVELKRQCKDGTLIPVTENLMDGLDVRSSIASTAGSLQYMSHEQKTQWAIETKDYANALYEHGMYKDAILKYVECLTATKFGTNMATMFKDDDASSSAAHTDAEHDVTSASESSKVIHSVDGEEYAEDPEANNIKEVVIPALNNLVACSMKLYSYQKAILFCKQLLKFDPKNYKGCYRLAQCYVHTGGYIEAVKVLNELEREYEARQETQTPADSQTVDHASLDLSEPARDDNDDGNGDSEEKEDTPPQTDPSQNRVSNLDYIRGLRRRAMNGIEREKQNKARQQAAMKAAFGGAAPSVVKHPPAGKQSSSPAIESENLRASSSPSQSQLDPSSQDSALKPKRKTSSVNDVAVILLYISSLLCVSAVIVRLILDYAPV